MFGIQSRYGAARVVAGFTLAFAMGSGGAFAATFDFTGSGGLLGKTSTFTSGAFSVDAIAINTQELPAPQLHQDSDGLGVDTDDGNQLDNTGDDEGIVFDFGSLFDFTSITLTAASTILGNDDWEIYGTNDGSVTGCTSGGLACLTGVSDLLDSGTGAGFPFVVDVDLTGFTYRYLIATTPGGSGADYRVGAIEASLSTQVAAVPLPAALPFFGTGLALLGFAGWRRRRSTSA